ncbi:DNA polymerase III PolC-type [bacterium AB1]|nr:DNA polymerase III PolC-type [bacterium AB1]
MNLYAIVDSETTGLNVYLDEIFNIGIIITDGIEILDKIEIFINIGINKLQEAKKKLHKIVNIDLNYIQTNGVTLQKGIIQINEFLEKNSKKYNCLFYFVAHNAKFDYSIICSNLNKVTSFLKEEFLTFFIKIVDTISLFKKYYKHLKFQSYKLDSMVENLHLPKHYPEIQKKINERSKEGHSALLDAEITFYLFKKVNVDFPFIVL